MKKWVKILLAVLLVMVIAVASLALWQWKNIESIYVGINETPEEIAKRRNDNQKGLVDDVNKYLDEGVREMTEEEKQKIESGEVTAEDVYLQIFEEKQAGNGNENQDSDTKKENSSANASKTKDEIVVKYMAKLYSLQSKYTAKAEVTISEGKKYYKNQRKSHDAATARANTISHFTPIVRGVENSCDSEFEKMAAELEKELKAIDADTDIVRTISSAYKNEKQLKLSYYANRYLK